MSIPILPVGLVQSMDRDLAAAVATAASPFTGTQQVQDWGGRWWEYSFDFKITKGREARQVSAFLAALGGPAGKFLFSDPTIEQSGTPGTPVVAGVGQSGTTLATDGWPASATVLYAGDFFSLGADDLTRLYQLTDDVVTDGSGAATLSFVPALREVPADGDPLEVLAPKVVLRLSSRAPAKISKADKFQFSLTAREAI